MNQRHSRFWLKKAKKIPLVSRIGMNVKYKVRREEKKNSRRKEYPDQRYRCRKCTPLRIFRKENQFDMVGIQNVWKEAEKDGNTRWVFLRITCSQIMKDLVFPNKENEFHSVDNGISPELLEKGKSVRIRLVFRQNNSRNSEV